MLRTRDLAAAASDGDDAIGAQLRATFGAKKLAPASLLVALVARAVASDDGGGADGSSTCSSTFLALPAS